jgi:hypothetical protein
VLRDGSNGHRLQRDVARVVLGLKKVRGAGMGRKKRGVAERSVHLIWSGAPRVIRAVIAWGRRLGIISAALATTPPMECPITTILGG